MRRTLSPANSVRDNSPRTIQGLHRLRRFRPWLLCGRAFGPQCECKKEIQIRLVLPYLSDNWFFAAATTTVLVLSPMYCSENRSKTALATQKRRSYFHPSGCVPDHFDSWERVRVRAVFIRKNQAFQRRRPSPLPQSCSARLLMLHNFAPGLQLSALRFYFSLSE